MQHYEDAVVLHTKAPHILLTCSSANLPATALYRRRGYMERANDPDSAIGDLAFRKRRECIAVSTTPLVARQCAEVDFDLLVECSAGITRISAPGDTPTASASLGIRRKKRTRRFLYSTLCFRLSPRAVSLSLSLFLSDARSSTGEIGSRLLCRRAWNAPSLSRFTKRVKELPWTNLLIWAHAVPTMDYPFEDDTPPPYLGDNRYVTYNDTFSFCTKKKKFFFYHGL